MIVDDFDECWDTIRKKSPILAVTDKASDLWSQLEIACGQTIFALDGKIREYEDKPLTKAQVRDLVSSTVITFMSKWRDQLREQNLSGLIEIVLEGQNLSPEEMLGFLRALPDSLLTKITQSPISSTESAIRALVSIVVVMRARGVRSYTMGRELDRTYVEFVHEGSTVKMFLDEHIEVRP